jgi:hypothetical protein
MIAFIVSLGFSKLAVVAFVHNLTPSALHRRINFGVTILVSLWLFGSVLVAVFECHPPYPWDRRSDRCIDRVSGFKFHSLWAYILTGIVNVVECRLDSEHSNGNRNRYPGNRDHSAASCEATAESFSHEPVCFPIAVSSNSGA